MVPLLGKTIRKFLKMLNLGLPRDQAMLILGPTPKRNETTYPHRNLCANVHSDITHSSQTVAMTQKSIT